MTIATRIPLLERNQVPPELGALYDALLQQRGVVPNMFKTVANVPGLALGFAALLKPLLRDGALPGWYKELIATRMSVLCGSEYATSGHATSAKQKGASDAQIAAVKSDFDNGPFSDSEKLGLRCADRLHRSGRELDDDFYDKLKSVFSDQQIVELVATASVFEFFPRFVDGLRIPLTPAPVPAGKV
ncbi:MAG: carboxymuconolactone decarboxylase family protein [Acidobacteria bacterium]|nr:MAG: carboxymuconolactone decarboxylase family protein [Acidobacteriota bacterium]